MPAAACHVEACIIHQETPENEVLANSNMIYYPLFFCNEHPPLLPSAFQDDVSPGMLYKSCISNSSLPFVKTSGTEIFLALTLHRQQELY